VPVLVDPDYSHGSQHQSVMKRNGSKAAVALTRLDNLLEGYVVDLFFELSLAMGLIVGYFFRDVAGLVSTSTLEALGEGGNTRRKQRLPSRC